MSTEHSPDGLEWRRSSYSGGAGAKCVEVAAGDGVVHVRDSKTPRGPVLTFTPEAWAAFTAYACRTPGTARRF